MVSLHPVRCDAGRWIDQRASSLVSVYVGECVLSLCSVGLVVPFSVKTYCRRVAHSEVCKIWLNSQPFSLRLRVGLEVVTTLTIPEVHYDL